MTPYLLVLLFGALLGAGGYHWARTRFERPAPVEAVAVEPPTCWVALCADPGHKHPEPW